MGVAIHTAKRIAKIDLITFYASASASLASSASLAAATLAIVQIMDAASMDM